MSIFCKGFGSAQMATRGIGETGSRDPGPSSTFTFPSTAVGVTEKRYAIADDIHALSIDVASGTSCEVQKSAIRMVVLQ